VRKFAVILCANVWCDAYQTYPVSLDTKLEALDPSDPDVEEEFRSLVGHLMEEEFRSLVGHLMWLANRPDIYYSVRAQFD